MKLRLLCMYCSGHTTLADGRLFYTGGARYSDISSPWEMEWGELKEDCCGTIHVTRHTSHVTRHTSHVTRHTSHVTRHTSHVTRHTSHVTRHRFGLCAHF
jgi:hypothetical protein